MGGDQPNPHVGFNPQKNQLNLLPEMLATADLAGSSTAPLPVSIFVSFRSVSLGAEKKGLTP